MFFEKYTKSVLTLILQGGGGQICPTFFIQNKYPVDRIHLNPPDGGQICPDQKNAVTKECTAATRIHIFWSIMF